jgi:glycine cleavage system aminomethyltransferase T
MMGVELQNGAATSHSISHDGSEIGEITSVAFSPSMNKTIGLAFVKTAFANPGAEVSVGAESAKLVKLPFDI